MEEDYTAGPWEVNGWYIQTKLSKKPVCLLYRNKDNASKIAATPDLLAALEAIIATKGDIAINDRAWLNAIAIAAKARGEA